MVLAASIGVSPAPTYSGYQIHRFDYQYRTFTLYGPTFQTVLVFSPMRYSGPTTPQQPKLMWFGLFRVRSPLLTKSLACFLFLWLLRCFSSPGSLSHHFRREYTGFTGVGCPIRTSADHLLLTDPRSLSQFATSFFASESQGIHHVLLFCFSVSLCSMESYDPDYIHYLQYFKEPFPHTHKELRSSFLASHIAVEARS